MLVPNNIIKSDGSNNYPENISPLKRKNAHMLQQFIDLLPRLITYYDTKQVSENIGGLNSRRNRCHYGKQLDVNSN